MRIFDFKRLKAVSKGGYNLSSDSIDRELDLIMNLKYGQDHDDTLEVQKKSTTVDSYTALKIFPSNACHMYFCQEYPHDIEKMNDGAIIVPSPLAKRR